MALAPDPPTLAGRQLLFMNYLMGRGRSSSWPLVNGVPIATLTAESAAAVTGSATGESEVQSVDLNAEGSDGAIQWLGSRLTAMKAWATTNFGDWKGLEPQAAYTVLELMTSENKAGQYILNPGARTIATLVFDFVEFDERPANPVSDANTRIIFANQCYALLGANPQPTPIPTPTPAPIPITLPPLTVDQVVSIINLLKTFPLTTAQNNTLVNILLKFLGA